MSRVDDSTLGIEAALNNEDEESKVALSSSQLAVSSEQGGVSRKESVRRAVSEASDPLDALPDYSWPGGMREAIESAAPVGGRACQTAPQLCVESL